ncbi:MAG: hypothetical protein IPH75_12575 [bacterium]|nr:hypothetical protein [bacterium]
MKRLLWVVALALVAGSVQAGRVTITSLPYTISTSNDTFYISGTKLSSQTIGLNFAAGVSNVLVDGQGDTIQFGLAGSAPTGSSPVVGDIGIKLNNGTVTNVVIRNLKVLHAPPQSMRDSTVHCWAQAVRWGPSNRYIRLEGCTFKVVGRNSKIMYSGGGSYNNDVINCVFIDSCHAYLRRDYWNEQAMINLQDFNRARSLGSDFQYHWRFAGCSTAVAFWSNVHLEGDSTVADFDNNYWFTDGWNSLYGTAEANSMTTATENYCIALRQGDNAIADGCRIKIRNNRFRAGTAHSGGRGIFISGVEGINYNYDDSCIAIYNNDFNVHQGFDGYAATIKGIIMREDWGNVRVHHNNIVIPMYQNPPNNGYGQGPSSGVQITSNFGYNLYMKHNTISTYFVDNFSFDDRVGSGGVAAYCVVLDENEMNSPNLLIDSNTFITNNVFIRWGFFNGHGGNPQFRGNTFQYYGGTSPNNDNTWTAYLGYGAPSTHHAYNNFLIDPIFNNGVSETHVVVSDAEPDSLQLGYKVSLAVSVRGNNSLPVANATVTVRNNYGFVVGQGTTNGNGVYTALVTYRNLFNAAFSNPDSTNYNPFSIKAKVGNDSTTISYTVGWNTKTPQVTLANTGGSGGGTDVTPPGTITTLGAIAGPDPGSVLLTWDAPGDDDNTGTASGYYIKYSSNEISSDLAFENATSLENPPTPSAAGVRDEALITNLLPGRVYYVAVKAYDNEGNVGELSNESISFAKGIAPPLADSVRNSIPFEAVRLYAHRPASYYQINHEYQIDTTADFTTPRILVDASTSSSSNVSISFGDLTVGETYRWRVRSFANDSSDFSVWVNGPQFLFDPNISTGGEDVDTIKAYPNPLRLAENQSITFTDVPASSELIILTVSGEVVMRWDVDAKQDIHWDARNESGEQVASGTYLWYITGTSERGKLIVIH